MSIQEYYTTKDLVERFGVSVKTLRRWQKRKKNPLPSYRFGRDYRFKVGDVARWEEGLRVFAGAEDGA